MEPYRIKAVEPIPFLTPGQRAAGLAAAGYNLFRLDAAEVTIDLLTDSGTGAMSARQWSALMNGDESYAGARSYRRFEDAVRELTGHRHVLPVHQGRAAERILFQSLPVAGRVTLANGHFDTTIANVLLAGGDPVDLPGPEARDDAPHPFKGNLDLDRLAAHLAPGHPGPPAALVVLTVTDNAGGGHPVSPAHAREVAARARAAGVPFFLDAARFAENAHLVTRRDPAAAGRSAAEVARELFRLADGSWCSMKKDAFGNIGGFLTLQDDELAERCRNLLIATEGYTSYGGLSGRDLEALATGLAEATDPDYLADRESTTAWFARALQDAGVPVLTPPGCHAVYLDAAALLPHLPARSLPAVSLACELYRAGGVRCAEMGSLTFGRPDPAGGPDTPARRELLRLALPRRVYTRSHLEHVVRTAAAAAARADRLGGYRIVRQPPHLRHFSAVLAPETAA
ncbi:MULTISPECIES: tryptophanase [Kitasatospora]|uniref:Putative tryptophanase n=1 Tax=Kitasatospora setae (strain ATCC 33774 / DSM 43861 / JCM 3304 / KCC A-0304 / NBRC 14216 / KM-6054) TaxID=452652 RepID=E4N526_KITSK|nr:tryptophanase [Kitasatospora setae]BAJ26307.1 putative tryptophanase [Kitasatospora setae KM-6054]